MVIHKSLSLFFADIFIISTVWIFAISFRERTGARLRTPLRRCATSPHKLYSSLILFISNQNVVLPSLLSHPTKSGLKCPTQVTLTLST